MTTIVPEKIPPSVRLDRMPWINSAPFLKITADATAWPRTLLVVCAVPETSRRTILVRGNRDSGVNGCVVTIGPGSELLVSASVTQDGRDPQEEGGAALVVPTDSRRPLINELPFTFGVIGFARATTPEDVEALSAPASFSVSGDLAVKAAGSLGFLSRPPIGNQVVTPRVRCELSAGRSIESGLFTATPRSPETAVLADFATGRSSWAPSATLGRMTGGASAAVDLRLRVLGTGTGWSILDSAIVLNAAGLTVQTATKKLLTDSAPRESASVGPYPSMAACLAEQTARMGSAEARRVCEAFAGSGSRG